jgi:Bacteriophage tail sheath protein
MPEYSTPGVYYERADVGTSVISPLRTDITGFVGIARRGPLHVPVVVESWRQFVACFGEFTGAGYLAYAVRSFFENGGRRCWIVRVASPAASTSGVVVQDLSTKPHPPTWLGAWLVRAANPGVWGDDLDIALRATHRAQTTGRLTDGLFEYLEVASVTGFSRATHVRIVQPSGTATFHVISCIDAEHKRLYFVSPKPELSLSYDAPLIGIDANQNLLIESVEYTLLVRQQGRLIATYDGLTLVPEHLHYGPRVLADPVEERAEGDSLESLLLAADEMPDLVVIEDLRAPSEIAQLQPIDPLDAFTALTGGTDGLAALSISDFIGDPDDLLASYADRVLAYRGLRALERVSELAIVAIPDINIQPLPPPQKAPLPPCVPDPCLPDPPLRPATPRPPTVGDLPPLFTEQQIFAVQSAMIEQCEQRRDRIALLDPPYALVRDDRLGIGAVRAWRQRFDSKYAAFYFPWLKVEDPLRLIPSLIRDVPPSGHVAGFYAKTDSEIGCHKAPANGALAWVQDATVAVAEVAHGVLNAENINAIRAFPGRGLRIFGARTVSSDPDWRYVNVRRLLMMIEKAVHLSCQWAVFEPNNVFTRAKLHLALTSFLLALWQRGALMGASAREAFFVRCNKDNNPAAARDDGQLLAEVGVAPSKPFEFVVLRVGRTDNEFEITEQGFAGGSL